MYYNSTNLEPEQVKIFATDNLNQDDIVRRIIKQLNKPFSASSIYKRYPIANVPITSIRRSINTLMNLNEIEPTGLNVKGIYGKPEKQYHETM
jgi:hypothetical protein